MKKHNKASVDFLSKVGMLLVEFFGIAVFFIAVLTSIALLSYNAEDISLNTAIDCIPANILSYVGSYCADIMMQCFGISAFLFSVFLFSFGYQLIKYHTVSFFRILSAIISVVAFTTAASIAKINDAGIAGQFCASLIPAHISKSNSALFVGVLLFVGLVACLLAVRFHVSIIKQIFFAYKEHEEQYDNPEMTNSVEDIIEKPAHIRTQPNIPSHQLRATRSGTDGFVLPPLALLKEAILNNEKFSESDLKARSLSLINVLNDFGIDGEIADISHGPVVTLYELKPAAGIKSSRVIGLSNDIARYMSAVSARVAVIPGKNALGIELPNLKRQTVYLRELLESHAYNDSAFALPIALGKDISGEPIIVDLAKMPHLLIAGTTGSGKSVGINAMLMSLLYKLSPSECKFIMIDPKMLELSVYDDIPHLLTPVVTDPKKAVVALKWAVKEMETRYMSMSKLGVRNIEGYNAKLAGLKKMNEQISRRIHTGFDQVTGAPIYETQVIQMDPIPYIVIVVDEMADLMLVAGKDIEITVQRLAQMARAAGIHLIMATQRPSVDVITGTIKANFPTRISFQVSSKIDSRTILGEQGAEQLLGQGDMLYMASVGRMIRVHCPFVSDVEVEKVTSNLKSQLEPQYISTITDDDESDDDNEFTDTSDNDPLYNEAVLLILREGKAATSLIQRHLKIGYNRAARIMDMMESAGIVSAANHAGKREILGQ